MDIFANNILNMCVISWLSAQFFKIPFNFLRTKKWDYKACMQAGGFPSSHSSTVCTLCVGVAKVYGVSSTIFAIVAVFSGIVMYDAMGVRRAAGDQAKVINLLTEFMEDFAKKEFNFDNLREVLGHTPIEVAAGIAWGVGIGLLMPA
ncbi:MAG: divergent PAP2 family protein [Clostridia bacterium]|nr:divergent PAP2 family protein [Clostridia bacterium]MDD4798097.1 divergent PAP2 family protein [Clostridia bacterium]